MTKSTYLEKLATNFILDLPSKVITKEQAMNYYMHEYKGRSCWDKLDVNDILTAAQMAGKQIKGNSLLEINVSFREQLEFHAKEGHNNKHIMHKKLEENKSLIIGSYLEGVAINEIAFKIGCENSTITRFLIRKGIKEKVTKQNIIPRSEVSISA